jgi:hypothetical protein
MTVFQQLRFCVIEYLDSLLIWWASARPWNNLSYYPQVPWWDGRKSWKILNQDSRSPFRDLTMGCPEYEMLTTEPRFSVCCNFWTVKYNDDKYIKNCFNWIVFMKRGQLAAPYLKRLVAGFPPRRPGSSHVGFVVDKVGAGAGFRRALQFSLPIFIPPISPQSPSPIIRGWYNRPVSGRSTQSPTPLIKKNLGQFHKTLA